MQGLSSAFLREICFLSCVIRYAPSVQRMRLNATVNTVTYIMASESPPVNMSTNGIPTNAQLENVPTKMSTSRFFRCSSPFIKRKQSFDAPNVRKIAATENKNTHKKFRRVSPSGGMGSTANA